jgi:hypothetical protein
MVRQIWAGDSRGFWQSRDKQMEGRARSGMGVVYKLPECRWEIWIVRVGRGGHEAVMVNNKSIE